MPILLSNRTLNILDAIAIVLIFAWLGGILSAYMLGGFIHLLLIIAIILFLIRGFHGNRRSL